MDNQLISFIRELYQTADFIPLHAPNFQGNEQQYVLDTLHTTFVSSVGAYVGKFEQQIATYTNSPAAVATVNGTAALHTALFMAGVRAGDLVITQPLTFVATCNAIHHCGAEPVFVDVHRDNLGLCPDSLTSFLTEHAELTAEGCQHKATGRRIVAVVPMHTFGHPAMLDELQRICDSWQLTLIEDAAESLGSFYKGIHTGTVGRFGTLSFNGNKIITTGGGGMLLCRQPADGLQARHLTTTAKQPHAYEFYHDTAGFNYRLPNLNAALGCAQMERLSIFLQQKRRLAARYQQFFAATDYQFVTEPAYGQSNYWLNAVICPSAGARQQLLDKTNQHGVMTRPVWQLMHQLPMHQNCLRGPLPNACWLAERLVNLPSSPILLQD